MNSTIKLLEGLKIDAGTDWSDGYNRGLDAAIERLRTVNASRDEGENTIIERIALAMTEYDATPGKCFEMRPYFGFARAIYDAIGPIAPADEVVGEPIYLRDLDGTGSMHVCAKGDPGAIEYVPSDPPTQAEAREAGIRECIAYLENLAEADLKLVSHGDFEETKRHWQSGASAQKRAMISQLRALLTEGEADHG